MMFSIILKTQEEQKILHGLMSRMVLNFVYLYVEHFIVWMRTAGIGRFKKIWGRINT